MIRWALVPAAVFVLAFAGSLAYFELDDGDHSQPGRAAEPAQANGRLVVTYSATADNPTRAFSGASSWTGPTSRT